MRLLKLSDLPLHNASPSVVTIGNFDGVHIGHQFVLKKVKEIAEKQYLTSTVVRFEPQPKEFFSITNNNLRLTPFDYKIKAFESAEMDQTLLLSFTQKIADLTPYDFVKNILKHDLNTRHVIVGNDFRFGHNRVGDFAKLKKLGEQFGFNVTSLPDYTLNKERVSSGQILNLLQNHNFNQAKVLLGRAYTLSGLVHYGDQNARKIGFPTINLPMPKIILSGGLYR